jgi:hypothetical protein
MSREGYQDIRSVCLEEAVMLLAGGWNWFRIVSTGGLLNLRALQSFFGVTEY